MIASLVALAVVFIVGAVGTYCYLSMAVIEQAKSDPIKSGVPRWCILLASALWPIFWPWIIVYLIKDCEVDRS